MMKDEINECLTKLLDHLNEGRVKEACSYSLLAGGKRLRPMLMLTALQSYNLNYHHYIDLACAIEMIHTYSLIHDDLPTMDDDDLRRGRPTCHKAFDEATATLAGDALLTEAFYILSNSSELSAEKRVKIIQILSESAGQAGMVYGQQQDILFENKKATLEQLKDIHAYKTGCLIQAPLMMAAVIANEKDLPAWQRIGANIGQAFQIQDDILDVIGDEKKLGKKTGADEKHHKSTYVSLLGLEQAKEEVNKYYRETLADLYQLQINHGLMIGLLESLVQRDA